MKKYNALLKLSLFLGFGLMVSCGGAEDNAEESLPKITIVSPSDTIGLSDSIAVRILYNDNTGLIFTDISLGTQSGGNLVYHNSQRGLAGTSDEIEFKAIVPSVVGILGENYILVKAKDEDGNEAVKEQSFFVEVVDNTPPVVVNSGVLGFLSQDPNTAFEVAYQLSDDNALKEVEISLLKWANNTPGDLLASQTISLQGQAFASGTALFPGSTSYSSGQDFRIKFILRDQAGNSVVHYVVGVYTVN